MKVILPLSLKGEGMLRVILSFGYSHPALRYFPLP